MHFILQVTTTESPPPFREPPPPVPPAQLIRIDSKKLRVSYNNKTTNHLDSLSDDLVLKIFQFLPKNNLCKIARVCRRFYFLVWEAELWTHIGKQKILAQNFITRWQFLS